MSPVCHVSGDGLIRRIDILGRGEEVATRLRRVADVVERTARRTRVVGRVELLVDTVALLPAFHCPDCGQVLPVAAEPPGPVPCFGCQHGGEV